MNDTYEWKVIDRYFVLHRNDEPTQVTVSYCRGGWQVFDGDDTLVIDAISPFDAMDSVNREKDIDAPYDKNGLKKIETYLDELIRESLYQIEDSIIVLRDDLVSLKGVNNDMVFMVRQQTLDDELQIAYDTIDIVRRRYMYPIRTQG